MEVDTLGNLLAIVVIPAIVQVCTREQERDQVAELSRQVQDITGDNVKLVWVDQGYTGDATKEAAKAEDIKLEVVKLPESKPGFVLLPRRWVHKYVNGVLERSFGWKSRFRRLVRDYERLPEVVAGLHFVVFGCLLLTKLFSKTAWGS